MRLTSFVSQPVAIEVTFPHANDAQSAAEKRCSRRRPRLPRRTDADRIAGHAGRALLAQPDLHLRAFVRRRDGHRRQSAGREHQLSRSAGEARRDPGGRHDPASADAPATSTCSRAGRWKPSAASCCTAPTSSSRIPRCRSTTASASPRRSTSSRRSRAATARRARSSRSATPAGRRVSSKTRCSRTAGCIAAPIRDLIFGTDIGAKYDRALQKIGIRPGMLSSEVGHA